MMMTTVSRGCMEVLDQKQLAQATMLVYKDLLSDPDNFRGTTLLSCTSKLFISCLNSLLSCYFDQHILGQEQTGFRGGHCTIEHVFVLHVVFDLYNCALESMETYLLLLKIYNNDNAKSCLVNDNIRSEYCMCSTG